MRNVLQKNSPIVLIVSLLVLGASTWMLLGAMDAGPDFDRKWMYDLAADELVVAPKTQLAPSDASGRTFDYPDAGSAGSLVDAVLYGCGNHGQPKPGMSRDQLASRGVHIGYLSRYPDPVKAALEAGESLGGDAPHLIADASGAAWVRELSPQGDAILAALSDLCGGDVPRAIRP
ncbi:MAG: hypothetical protein AAF823_06635 [Planctomycetota bacterium]